MSRHATTKLYRFYEIIPGTLTWGTFILAGIFSFIAPLGVIYFVLVFDLFWFFRFMYLLGHLLVSFRRFRRDVEQDWQKQLDARFPDWRRMWQMVFLPSASASPEVVAATLEGLRRSSFPAERMIVVVALEERAREVNSAVEEMVRQRYMTAFGHVLITWHPDGVPGEVRGKGANQHHAGHIAQAAVDEWGIAYENIIVSSFDIDTVVHQQYFSYLTVKYLEEKNPTRFSFQPVPLYNNNVWEAPALTRVAANSTSFWLMTEQTRPEAMFTFSSHSMSFKALVDVGFWQKDIVTEDSRIFLQCFFRYDGDYQTKPLYLPVSMDAVQGASIWRSMVNIYKQQRRWAWGIEHLPYMLDKFRKNTRIPLRKKIRYVFKLAEGMYSWATAPILILVLGRLPLWLASGAEKTSVIAQNAPYVLSTIMNISLVGLLVSGILSTILLPSRPERRPRYWRLWTMLQWVLFPIVMIIFGSVPATDAQTRLLLGKELGFWVTEKGGKGGG